MNPPVVPMSCPACALRHCVDHCAVNRSCTWWKCQACGSFGSKVDQRFVDCRPKDKRK